LTNDLKDTGNWKGKHRIALYGGGGCAWRKVEWTDEWMHGTEKISRLAEFAHHCFVITNWCTRELLLRSIKIYIKFRPAPTPFRMIPSSCVSWPQLQCQNLDISTTVCNNIPPQKSSSPAYTLAYFLLQIYNRQCLQKWVVLEQRKVHIRYRNKSANCVYRKVIHIICQDNLYLLSPYNRKSTQLHLRP